MDKARFKKLTDNVIGNVLVYDDGGDILFFGFFGVYDHDPIKIEILIDKLIDYAKNNNYKYIRGPINIPTVIFGWGFMVEGSNMNYFIGCPVNPPIYQQLFLKKKFFIKFKEDRYMMLVYRYNPYKDKRYDFSEYEYFNPGKEGMIKVKEEYIKLHIDYMPPSARITPKSERNFDNIIDFIFEYGSDWMMWTVYHKPTKKMCACGYVIPNPFSKDLKGQLDSISFHDWVVHPDHRRKGLAMLMYGATSLKAFKHKARWGSWPVGAENIANIKAAEKMGGKRDRTHSILEINLDEI
ncbi:MAG: GNAT family N-acetyltransferase [Promethearchaeota archaeon]